MKNMIEQAKSFLLKCVRVWHLLRKPTIGEVKNVSKISSLGMAAIGAMGFIIGLVMNFVYPRA